MGGHRVTGMVIGNRHGAGTLIRAVGILLCSLVVTGCLSWREPHYPGGKPDKSYTVIVEEGESYASIAKRLNLSVDELMTLNRARKSSKLRAGDKLLLPEPSLHVVKENETLYSIARRYNVSYERLARVNGIRNPHDIRPGVRLRIPESETATAKPLPKPIAKAKPAPQPRRQRRWWEFARPAPTPTPQPAAFTPRPSGRLFLDWPVRGPIISEYGDKGRGVFNDGINIAVRNGTPIRAAADGVVIYRGNLVPGFGRLILIKHRDEIVTAYAHLGTYGVREGDPVQRGQIIGRAGSSGNVDFPQLHFEVRRGVSAVDPMPFLSRRG